VSDLTADPELLAGFLDESTEALDSLDRQFVAMEARPEDKDPVNVIFRAVHSLKGNAAFFGFTAVKELAHDLENLLDQVRKGNVDATRPVIDALLAGLDMLKAMVAALRQGVTEPPDRPAYDAMRQRQRDLASAKAPPANPAADLAIIAVHAALLPADAQAALGRLRAALAPAATATAAAPDPGPVAALTALLDAAEKGTADHERCAGMAGLIDQIKAKAGADAGDLALVAEMREGFDAFFPAMGADPMLLQYLRERLPKLSAATRGAPPAAAAAAAPDKRPRSEGGVARPEAGKSDGHKADAAKTMRVPEASVDSFLAQVGELLVIGDLYNHIQKRLASNQATRAVAKDVRRANETFTAVSNKLQRGIMGLRQVPVKPLMSKVPRLVRDVATARGKDIRVVLEGEDLMVDKSLIDLLDAPLTHISRNAADHGVEKPEVRVAAGKPAQGTVTVSTTTTDRMVCLSISDDGGGLNLDALRKKGESIGLIPPGAALTEADLVNLIFAPGVSTAQEVTDISGRGVGMDVVKRAVDESGGSIQVTTAAGVGTSCIIRIPKNVTTQILPGYLVRIGDRAFALPLDRVLETFKATADDIHTAPPSERCVLRRGEVLPAISATELLHNRAHDWNRRSHLFVTVTIARRKVALAIDGVVGVQKIVLRPLAGLPPGAEVVAGSALLGDGGLALVLDLERLHRGAA
jgi:two-component system, chemotaxis family, sensor kinase CheA